MAGRVGKSVAVYTVQAPCCILFRMEVWCVQRERERERKRERERWRERGGERKRENEREKVREAVLHR